MGLKINHKGIPALYAKVKQVNIRNSHMTSSEILEDGTVVVTELATRPMDIVMAVYDNAEKGNEIDKFSHKKSYDPAAADKDPVNQAYALIKPELDVVEDLV